MFKLKMVRHLLRTDSVALKNWGNAGGKVSKWNRTYNIKIQPSQPDLDTISGE